MSLSGELPAHSDVPGTPLLVVLSGPSGVGKDAALNRLRTLRPSGYFVVTATTRARRSKERDGVDYIFLEPAEFHQMVDREEFLECAQVYGNWYGVLRQQVREALQQGKDAILKVDVQGAATIKSLVPEAVFIFLAPPSMEELRERLRKRATESEMDLDLRTSIAWEEMKSLPAFEYKVVNRNGCLAEAVACLDAIIMAESCRIPNRHISV